MTGWLNLVIQGVLVGGLYAMFAAGLSPVRVDRVLVVVRRLRESGTAVLLVEQLIEKALAHADRVFALARGSIVLEAKAGEADLPLRLERAYLASTSHA